MDAPRSPREIRLRPEFAELYPALRPGEWLLAAEWAAAVAVRAREVRSHAFHPRTFNPRHFEFRGGAPPRGGEGEGLRTRADDR